MFIYILPYIDNNVQLLRYIDFIFLLKGGVFSMLGAKRLPPWGKTPPLG